MADVLHLLAATKKTGCLRLDGTRGSGSVWVDGGEVVGIAASHAPQATAPAEAMFELLRFEDGSFLFEADARADAPGVPTDVDSLLADAGVLLSEWREIEAVVPSLDSRAALARSIEGDGVTVSAALWPALAAVGDGTTVRSLGERLGLGELPVSRTVRDLVALGVVELAVPTEPVAPAAPAASRPVDVAPASVTPVSAPLPVEQPESEPEPQPEPLTSVAPLAAPLTPAPASTEHLLPPVAWAADEFEADAPAEPEAPSDPDALPVARPIKARKARARTAESGPAQPERFVPLDLPGHMGTSPGAASAAADDEDADESLGQLDDLAAAFPGLANRVTADDDELTQQLAALSPKAAEALQAAAHAESDEELEAALDAAAEGEGGPINRGLLLKFLSSVKS